LSHRYHSWTIRAYLMLGDLASSRRYTRSRYVRRD
jgi:hypothetical protein